MVERRRARAHVCRRRRARLHGRVVLRALVHRRRRRLHEHASPGRRCRRPRRRRRAVGAPVVDGDRRRRLRPDPPQLGGAGVDRRIRDHRLPHPALLGRRPHMDVALRRPQHQPHASSCRATRTARATTSASPPATAPDGVTYSNIATAITSRAATVPSAPRSLTATGGVGSGQVRLNWTAPASTGGRRDHRLRHPALLGRRPDMDVDLRRPQHQPQRYVVSGNKNGATLLVPRRRPQQRRMELRSATSPPRSPRARRLARQPSPRRARSPRADDCTADPHRRPPRSHAPATTESTTHARRRRRRPTCSTPSAGSIGDFVWADANGDGRQDANEAGVDRGHGPPAGRQRRARRHDADGRAGRVRVHRRRRRFLSDRDRPARRAHDHVVRRRPGRRASTPTQSRSTSSLAPLAPTDSTSPAPPSTASTSDSCRIRPLPPPRRRRSPWHRRRPGDDGPGDDGPGDDGPRRPCADDRGADDHRSGPDDRRAGPTTASPTTTTLAPS